MPICWHWRHEYRSVKNYLDPSSLPAEPRRDVPFIVVAQIEGNSANIEDWPQLLNQNVRSFFHCGEQGSWYILQANRLSLWWVCISFHHHHWWFIPMIRSWRRPLVGSHPQLSLLRPHPSYWRPFVSTDCDISSTSLFSLHLSLLHSWTLERHNHLRQHTWIYWSGFL